MSNISEIMNFEQYTFNELKNKLISNELKNTTADFLNLYNIKKKERIFLTAFLIYHHPNDTLGEFKNLELEGVKIQMTPLDLELFEICKIIVTYCRSNNFKNLISLSDKIISFEVIFNNWKSKSKENLVKTLKLEYDYLIENIKNSPNEIKIYLENCIEDILRTAFIIGGEELVSNIKK